MITVNFMTTDIHGANTYFDSLTKSIKEHDLNAFSYLVQYFYGVYPHNAMICHSENKYNSRLVNVPIVDSVSWKDIHSYLLNVIENCVYYDNNQIPVFLLELFPSELEEIEQQLGDEFFAKKYIKEVREKNDNGWHISVKLEKIFEENDLNGFISLIPFFYEKYPFPNIFCRYDNNEQNKKRWTHASLPINNEKSWKDIHSYLLNVIEYCIEHENIQISIFLLELFPSELEEIEQQLGDGVLAKKFIKEVREKNNKLKMI